MTRNLALTIVLSFALFAKALIPAGWMPNGDKAFEITICTGTDTHSMWLDDKGALHKENPNKTNDGDLKDKPCSFAGLGAALDLPRDIEQLPVLAVAFDSLQPRISSVAIGLGLAAPPPPATGPPVFV